MKKMIVPALVLIAVIGFIGCGSSEEEPTALVSFDNQTDDYTVEAVRFGNIIVTDFTSGSTTQNYEIETGNYAIEVKTGEIWTTVSTEHSVCEDKRYVIMVSKNGNSYEWDMLAPVD